MEFFAQLPDLINKISGIVWGWPLLILLIGTGVYLTIGLGFMPLRKIGYGFKMLWVGRKGEGEGDISPFNALMTAMAATVGTGNIAGVAGAIAIGGPGAVFWMWITALVGMGTKYGEAVLAVRYREVDSRGRQQGGPMYYIKNGLGDHWRWMAFIFAFLGAIAAFGIGNMTQANSVAAVATSFAGEITDDERNMIQWVVGGVLAVLTALVILGGIKRLGTVTGKLVPFMAIAYILGALIIIFTNITQVPEAFMTILRGAFTGSAATGGFIGATIMLAMQKGVERGLFSNEAGMGTAPIAHAAAKTNDPVRQGVIAMLGTFLDTIVICTMTALVIILAHSWGQVGADGKQLSGAALTYFAFAQGLPTIGIYIVSLGLAFFAFSTLLGWSYYGERCAEYMLGVKVIIPYRVLWILAIPVGALVELRPLWDAAGILNGLMAIPNLIALLLLSPIIFKLTRDYFNK